MKRLVILIVAIVGGTFALTGFGNSECHKNCEEPTYPTIYHHDTTTSVCYKNCEITTLPTIFHHPTTIPSTTVPAEIPTLPGSTVVATFVTTTVATTITTTTVASTVANTNSPVTNVPAIRVRVKPTLPETL